MNAKDFDLLRRSDLFRFLPDEHFEKIRPLLQEERHDFGDFIVKQGEPASAFYILISGRARVVKSGSSNGDEIVLGTLRPGDSFGEAALTEGGTRIATVRCSTSVEVLRLDRADLPCSDRETVPELKASHRSDATRTHAAKFSLRIQQFRATAGCRRFADLIENLERVEVAKGRPRSSSEGDPPGRCTSSRKDGRALSRRTMARSVISPFIATGDFFGELSILNGSPRAASVEAYPDCRSSRARTGGGARV